MKIETIQYALSAPCLYVAYAMNVQGLFLKRSFMKTRGKVLPFLRPVRAFLCWHREFIVRANKTPNRGLILAHRGIAALLFMCGARVEAFGGAFRCCTRPLFPGKVRSSRVTPPFPIQKSLANPFLGDARAMDKL